MAEPQPSRHWYCITTALPVKITVTLPAYSHAINPAEASLRLRSTAQDGKPPARNQIARRPTRKAQTNTELAVEIAGIG